MITVTNLTKLYGRTPAVDAVSFDVNKGEVVGFLGPNGAGKTTTLRLITGFLTPTAGTATIDGTEVREEETALKKRIGYLPENNPLYDSMHVHEYLRFIADAKGISSRERRGEIQRVVRICQLQEKIAVSISDLSKGYRQRVGLAAALIGDPDVLLLDEPTSGLDPNQAAQLRAVIREIGKTKTILFSTHILQEVQSTCDRAIIIHHGKIVAQGTVQELTEGAKGAVHIRAVIEGSESEVITGLRALSGVEGVSVSEQHTYTVISNGSADVRPLIFALCVNQHWTLLELQRSQTSLEDVFRSLTT